MSGLEMMYLRHAAALENHRKGETSLKRWSDEPKTLAFWRAVIAELVGTMLLVFIGTASTIDGLLPGHTPSVLTIALTFGLTVATMIQCFGHVSGTHINPAVTLGVVISGGISPLKAIFYSIAQFVGAIVGSALLFGIVPSRLHGGLGANGKSAELTVTQGLFTELILTFVLVTTVLGTTDSNRPSLGLASLAIGLCVAVCHIAGIPLSGSSINPARSLGPPVVTATFPSYFWIYFVGPLVGGALAGVLYRFVFNPYRKTAPLSEITLDGVQATNGSTHHTRNRSYDGHLEA